MHNSLDNDNLIRSLRKFRGIHKYLHDNMKGFAENSFSPETTRYMVFPCDVVELRNIFNKRKVVFPTNVSLFSYFLAEKYLKNYPVFLIIDTKDLSAEKVSFGGVVLFTTDEIDISRLVRIVVKGPYQTVLDIVNEFNLGVECLPSNNVPALNASYKKVPKLLSSNNWYVKNAQISPSEDPEITFGPGMAHHQFRVGSKVRDRRGMQGYPNKGLGFYERFGMVKKVNSMGILVEWEKNEVKPAGEETFSFDDAISLFHILERI